jgi:hypothetical protein
MDGSVQINNNPEESSQIGWIILCAVLTVALIVFIIIWVICVESQNNQENTKCFGLYGVQAGVDANTVNRCGPQRDSPCSFAKNSLLDCQTQCDNLKSICEAYTFNFSTSVMKIVDKSQAFSSPSANLFVRQ